MPEQEYTIERWLPVVGYENSYAVSDLGRVRSLDRMVRRSRATTKRIRERVLKPCPNSEGYLHVKLSVDCKRRTCKVHQLVTEAFIGPRPDGLVVDHIDRDKLNNRVENLRYLTIGENGWRDRRGRIAPNARLTEDQVRSIRRRCLCGETQRAIAKDFEVCYATVSMIVSGKRWAWIPLVARIEDQN